MRLLFISTLSGWGGSEFLWSMAAFQALKEGHEVMVSVAPETADHEIIQQLRGQGAVVVARYNNSKTIFQKVYLKLNRYRSNWFPVYRNIDFEKPERIIISQGGSYECCYDLELFKQINSKSIPYFIISQYHDEYGSLDEFIYHTAREIFPKAKTIYFVSQRNREICELFISKRLQNAKVISNPMRIPDTKPLPYPPDETIQFACVARLDAKVKCQNILFGVMSQPQWKNRKWHLNLYGSGDDKVYLEELAQSLNLEDRISLHGHTKDIKEIWTNNHLLILPSSGEGCALSLIEAFGFGRTAIVTDVGGHEYLVHDNVTGFLSPGWSLKNLAMVLEKAWDVKHTWPQMGLNAFEHFQKHINPNAVGNLLREIIAI